MRGGKITRKKPRAMSGAAALLLDTANYGGFASVPRVTGSSTNVRERHGSQSFPPHSFSRRCRFCRRPPCCPRADVPRRRGSPARAPAWSCRHAPGGTTDIVARLLAAFLQQSWGQSCVVDNKSGRRRRHRLDRSGEGRRRSGQTLLMGNIGPQSIAYSLYRNHMPTTAPKSLIPVSNIISPAAQRAGGASLGAGHDRARVRRLAEGAGRQSLLRLLRHRPVAASVGGAWFLQLTGTKAEHIPYRGAAPALQDLTAGVTQFFFDNLTTGIEFVRAGKLRALGITSAPTHIR